MQPLLDLIIEHRDVSTVVVDAHLDLFSQLHHAADISVTMVFDAAVVFELLSGDISDLNQNAVKRLSHGDIDQVTLQECGVLLALAVAEDADVEIRHKPREVVFFCRVFEPLQIICVRICEIVYENLQRFGLKFLQDLGQTRKITFNRLKNIV